MSETKIFRKKDLDLEPVNGMKTIGLVNVSFSDKLGAGIGVFEDCSIPWHITYDEVIYILEGQFTLQVGDKIFKAGPGDVLWVPRNTDIVWLSRSEQEYPRSYVERIYNIQRWTEMPKGGHFAALEQPDLLVKDIRAFAKSL